MADESKTQHHLKYKGFLKAHGGWVTSLAVGEELVGNNKVEFLLSGSRDRTLIKWDLDDKKDDDEDREWGRPRKMYTGRLQIEILILQNRPLPLHQRDLLDRRLPLRLLRLLGWFSPSLERCHWQDHLNSCWSL